jgi:hypothetical protein
VSPVKRHPATPAPIARPVTPEPPLSPQEAARLIGAPDVLRLARAL